MDGPFFRNSWENLHLQSCFPQSRSDPHHRYNNPDAPPVNSSTSKSKLTVPVCNDARAEPSKSSSHAKSIVSIPIHLVAASNPLDAATKRAASSGCSTAKKASPPMTKADAAVKIQSAFRGFSIRKSAPLKNLKVIFQVKRNMEEIRDRIRKPQLADLVRQNEKERIRISEEIMSLLLKLDAVQGVNSDLRVARKSVVQELVKLQQTVDAIIAEKSAGAEASDLAVEGSVTPEIVSSREKNSQSGGSDVAGDVANEGVKIEGSSRCADQAGLITEKKQCLSNGSENSSATRQIVLSLPSSLESNVLEKSANPSCGEDADYVKEYTMESHDLSLGKHRVPPCTVEENMTHVREEAKCTGAFTEIDIISKFQAIVNPKGSICSEEEPEDFVLPEARMKDVICLTDETEWKQGASNPESMAPCDDEIGTGKWQVLESKGRMPDANLVVGVKKVEGKDDWVTMEGIGKAIDGEPKNEAETRAVERVREENKKLKKTVGDLCQRNDMQSDIISNLSQRIEQLEKQILRSKRNRKRKDRRKKKNASNNN